MRGTRMFFIAAVTATYSQAAIAQHGDFAPKVQLIVDYLKDSGEACISPVITGEQPFKACREGTDSVALTIVTDIPVRDDDGRVVDACSGKAHRDTGFRISGGEDGGVRAGVSTKRAKARSGIVTTLPGERPSDLADRGSGRENCRSASALVSDTRACARYPVQKYPWPSGVQTRVIAFWEIK